MEIWSKESIINITKPLGKKKKNMLVSSLIVVDKRMTQVLDEMDISRGPPTINSMG